MFNDSGEELPRFLVEWYRPDLARAPLAETCAALDVAAAVVRGEGHPVCLHIVLASPRDDVLFGVFGADCEDSVHLTCRRVGWTADRITADIDTRITPTA